MEHLLKVVLTIAVMDNMYTNMFKKKWGNWGKSHSDISQTELMTR